MIVFLLFTWVKKYIFMNNQQKILDPYFITGFEHAEEKSLVVLGQNLTSTVGVKFTRKQLAMVQLAPYQYSIIIGLLLSDGWLFFSNVRSLNASLGFKQSKAHSVYVWFIFNMLSHACFAGVTLI